MGLKETVAAAVTTAIAALGNIPKDVTYYSTSAGTYDSVTDTFTSTPTVVTCKGVVYKSKVESQEWKRTVLTETKLLIAGEVFADAGVVPKETDYVVIDSVRYEIYTERPAPSEPVYVFTLKAV